jgi:hypothetical protein
MAVVASSASGEAAAVDELVFERAPERLHGGIVVAVAPAAHRMPSLIAYSSIPFPGGSGVCYAIPLSQSRRPRRAIARSPRRHISSTGTPGPDAADLGAQILHHSRGMEAVAPVPPRPPLHCGIPAASVPPHGTCRSHQNAGLRMHGLVAVRFVHGVLTTVRSRPSA